MDYVGDILTGADFGSQIQQLQHGCRDVMLTGYAPVSVIGGSDFCVVDDLAVKEALAGRMQVAAVSQRLQRVYDWQVP